MAGNKKDGVHLADYLNNSSLDRPMRLTPNGMLTFHWANWEKTCRYFKDKLPECENTQQRLEDLNKELDELKGWRIWLKNKSKVIETTLYNLYEAYLDPRIRLTWFERREEILVSLHNQSGPYITLSSMRWIDKEIYKSFVQRKILTGFVQERCFRLNMDLPVRAYFDESSLNLATMTFYQVSSKGVLVKIHHATDLNRLLHCDKVTFDLLISPFQKAQEQSVPGVLSIFSRMGPESERRRNMIQVSLERDILERYNNQQNLRTSDGKSYFFFARYEDFIIESVSHKDGLNSIRDIVLKFEEHFIEELKEAA